MIKRILVPLDGSGLAERALPLAWGIASGAGADLLLMSAVVPSEHWAGLARSDPADAAERNAAQDYLESIAERLDKDRLKVRTLAVNDRAAPAICAAADAANCDLIVMATHGRSGFGGWLVGSVADRVRHTTDVPVLLVHARRETTAQAADIERILIPLDGSESAETVLSVGEELARALGAGIVLAQVIQSPAGYYPQEYSPVTLPTLTATQDAASEYLDRLAQIIRGSGVEVEVRVESGDPTSTLLDIASEGGIDMIAMATHGRSALGRFVAGSVADAICGVVDFPCLLIRARGATDGRGELSVLEDVQADMTKRTNPE